MTVKEEMELIKDKIELGVSNIEISKAHFTLWCRYQKSFAAYRLLVTPPRDRTLTPSIIIATGPTGTGKSQWAADNYPGAYWKPKGNWWCGYTNQTVVVLDEYYGWLPFDLLLRICDRYPLEVENKGGAINLVATTFIFTTNKDPGDWYKDVYFEAFERRITKILHFMAIGMISTFLSYKDYKDKQTIINILN